MKEQDEEQDEAAKVTIRIRRIHIRAITVIAISVSIMAIAITSNAIYTWIRYLTQ